MRGEPLISGLIRLCGVYASIVKGQDRSQQNADLRDRFLVSAYLCHGIIKFF
jgi:hypothetical protein